MSQVPPQPVQPPADQDVEPTAPGIRHQPVRRGPLVFRPQGQSPKPGDRLSVAGESVDYTSDRYRSVPVLSPKVSTGSPSLSSTDMCRFESGVSLAYLR